ncbi:protein rolling stone-like isoform X2 [Haliotis rufescens]|uniref:protein rolling stone-like isoform X2 n=1 Tax=Haliotis rufescens TaxID=6454 RepID=UPI00201EC43C|nr:protein rolling stone-like isoform X2 [Haliotis rufescens]
MCLQFVERMGIKSEFRTCNFGLNHSEPHLFVSSQWGHPRLYLSWRIFWALFHTSWLVGSMVSSTNVTSSPLGGALWFIYLTNWTYLLLTTSAVLDAVIVVFVRINRQDIQNGFTSYLPWYLKVSWLLYSVVTEGSLHISALYWIFIFKDQDLTLLRFILHGMNSIYVLSNLLITAMPVRLYHVIYPIICGFIYTLFSIVYHILGGTNRKGDPYIYKILDWSKLKRTLPLVFLSTFVALPFLYFVVFFIYKGRIYLRSKFCHDNNDARILDSSNERTDSECVRV